MPSHIKRTGTTISNGGVALRLNATRHLLVFQLPDHRCAFPLTVVQEIVALPWLSRPPTLPSLLEGFLNLGGVAIPVLRLERLLGLPDVQLDLYTPLILLRLSGQQLAVLVDSVDRIVGIAKDDFRPVPRPASGTHVFNDCVEGEVTLDGQVVHVLDPDRLLLEKETQCLSKFQAFEQQRLSRLEEPRP